MFNFNNFFQKQQSKISNYCTEIENESLLPAFRLDFIENDINEMVTDDDALELEKAEKAGVLPPSQRLPLNTVDLPVSRQSNRRVPQVLHDVVDEDDDDDVDRLVSRREMSLSNSDVNDIEIRSQLMHQVNACVEIDVWSKTVKKNKNIFL